MIQLANIGGRPALRVRDGRAYDVEGLTQGRWGQDVNLLVERLDELVELFHDCPDKDAFLVEHTPEQLGPPIPAPRQVFALGLNYSAHAEEAGRDLSATPTVFTKFPTCLTGPYSTVELPSERVDWEVELVVVIGRRADFVPEGRAWDHVAGLMVGQDLSERDVQRAGSVPQFSMGKSFRGFGPTGPALVPTSMIASDRDALNLGCSINGETMQKGSTRDLIFSIPETIAWLSAICPLLPGDLVFTGTPSGVGVARKPPRFLRDGDILESWIDGIGHLSNQMVSTTGGAARNST